MWTVLAGRLRASGVDPIPAELEAPAALRAHWQQRTLLFSQAWGDPYVQFLAGRFRLLGVFINDVPGATGRLNRSQLVVRETDAHRGLVDFRGRMASLRGIGEGRADLAAVACAITPRDLA